MLDISIKLEGDKVLIAGLKAAAEEMPRAIIKGFTRAGLGVYRESFAFLSGPGAKKSKVPPGGWPVPVRTGHLRRSLNWVKPGESKSDQGHTVTAGADQTIIYNAAPYAAAIHEGTWTQRFHDKRPFLRGGYEKFNQGEHVKEILMEEIHKEIRKNLKSK